MFDMKKIALFAAGTLFGSAGFKLLSSSDAKKVYIQTTAAVLRMKDSTRMQRPSTRPALPRLRLRSSRTLLRQRPPRPTSNFAVSEPPAGGSFYGYFLQYTEDILI